MCSHYQAATDRARFLKRFLVNPPAHPYIEDMWPKYDGVFIRRPPELESGDEAVPAKEAVTGRWGLVPWMTKDPVKQVKLSTFNARSETAARSFTFGGAWRRAQHCIIPVDAVYEPDWRTGKHIPTRISRADGEPLAIAGLWDRWDSPKGPVLSFTMLTINADEHPFMRDYHRPGDEKRMVVILGDDRHDAWLDAPADRSTEFMRPWPSEHLRASAVPAKDPKATA